MDIGVLKDWTIEGLSWDPVECGTDRYHTAKKKNSGGLILSSMNCEFQNK